MRQQRMIACMTRFIATYGDAFYSKKVEPKVKLNNATLTVIICVLLSMFSCMCHCLSCSTSWFLLYTLVSGWNRTKRTLSSTFMFVFWIALKVKFWIILLLLLFKVCPEGGGDKNAGCGYWRKLGYCSPDKGYYEFMETTCPATCGLCQGLFGEV